MVMNCPILAKRVRKTIAKIRGAHLFFCRCPSVHKEFRITCPHFPTIKAGFLKHVQNFVGIIEAFMLVVQNDINQFEDGENF